MERERTTKILILAIVASSVIGGELSFIVAGGIPMLASDVGIAGAWSVSLIIQFIYSALSVAGFIIFFTVFRNIKVLLPNLMSVIISAIIIASSINIHGVYHTGRTHEFLWFAIVFVAIAAVTHCVIALIVNSLTTRPEVDNK